MNPNKKINRILYAFVFVAFISILGSFLIASVGQNYLVDSKYDPRSNRLASKVVRGNILDRNENILKSHDFINGVQIRTTLYPGLFSNVVGYTDLKYGNSGIEGIYNAELLGRGHTTIWTKIRNIVLKDKRGDNVFTSLDLNLQKKAKTALGKFNGAVVVSNPLTGEILVSYSNPSFNENNLEDEVEKKEDSVMLDRVSFGKYTPGSVMKIITALNLLENGYNESYNDTGSIEIGESVISNYGKMKYGTVDMKESFTHSLNTYFVNANQKYFKSFIDFNNKINSVVLKNSPIPFTGIDITVTDSDFANSLLAIGQGKLTMSPLFLNIITQSVYNEGYFYSPRYVNKLESSDGLINKKIFSKKIDMPFKKKSSKIVKDYMKSVVNEGTAAGYGLVNCGGKTGTAELGNDLYNYIFTGFYEDEKNPLCITVVLEKTKNIGYNKSIEIFKKMIQWF